MGEIPFIHYLDTEKAANRFLSEYHPDGAIPVPVEAIIEHKLGMEIIPVPDLFERIGVSGFLANDVSAIYVDLMEMQTHEARYRFTLAHELGHRILHEAFYRQAKIQESEDFIRIREELSGGDLDRLEIQAMNFAGALLMPRQTLEKVVQEVRDEAEKKLGKDILRSPRFWSAVSARVAKQFLVSSEAAENRLRFGRFAK